jgi:hypothetical protein
MTLAVLVDRLPVYIYHQERSAFLRVSPVHQLRDIRVAKLRQRLAFQPESAAEIAFKLMPVEQFERYGTLEFIIQASRQKDSSGAADA